MAVREIDCRMDQLCEDTGFNCSRVPAFSYHFAVSFIPVFFRKFPRWGRILPIFLKRNCRVAFLSLIFSFVRTQVHIKDINVRRKNVRSAKEEKGPSKRPRAWVTNFFEAIARFLSVIRFYVISVVVSVPVSREILPAGTSLNRG